MVGSRFDTEESEQYKKARSQVPDWRNNGNRIDLDSTFKIITKSRKLLQQEQSNHVRQAAMSPVYIPGTISTDCMTTARIILDDYYPGQNHSNDSDKTTAQRVLEHNKRMIEQHNQQQRRSRRLY